MSGVQWFSGPPPAVGWWPASRRTVLDVYRWWDGEKWSYPAYREFFKEEAESWAQMVHVQTTPIQWRHWSIDIDGTDGRGAHL